MTTNDMTLDARRGLSRRHPPDAALHAAAKAQGVAMSLLSDYDLTGGEQDFSGTFVLG